MSDAKKKKQLALGLLFGVVFGFLLQKGGVAKYHVLLGVLLLEDFTVIKVMLSAIVVGMLGVFTLHAMGLVELHIKPTRYAANILGGLLFGVGFALMGYCPGTGAAALGQGNYDAIAGSSGYWQGHTLRRGSRSRPRRDLGKCGCRVFALHAMGLSSFTSSQRDTQRTFWAGCCLALALR